MTNKTIDGLDAITQIDGINDSLPIFDLSEGRTKKITSSGLFSSQITTLVADRVVYSQGGQLSTFPGFNFFASTGRLDVSSLTVSTGNLTVSAGQVLAAAGTAALPPYSFAAQTNMGFFLSGANQLDWVVTSGRLRFSVDTSWGAIQGGVTGNFTNGAVLTWGDGNNTLAQRNGANAQTLRVYGSYAATSTFIALSHNATDGLISTNAGGIRVGNTVRPVSTNSIDLGTSTSTFGACFLGPATTARATFNLPHGSDPSAPIDGDVWTTSSSAYVRINGATKDMAAVGITLGTATTAASTVVTFSTIPAGTKRIDLSFTGLSTTSVAAYQIKLGDAGGIETGGYSSFAVNLSAGGNTVTITTSAFQLMSGAAAGNLHNGLYTFALQNPSTFIWSMNGMMHTSSGTMFVANGGKTLSAELTQIQLTTATGTDTFDGGEVNIQYQ